MISQKLYIRVNGGDWQEVIGIGPISLKYGDQIDVKYVVDFGYVETKPFYVEVFIDKVYFLDYNFSGILGTKYHTGNKNRVEVMISCSDYNAIVTNETTRICYMLVYE